MITIKQMHEACEKEWVENYSHGEYCHEQSFRWGFQEGTEFAENEIKTKIINMVNEYLNEELYTTFDYFGDPETVTIDTLTKEEFINKFIQIIGERL